MASEITIKQLSKLSGFSKSTVSKALNNSNEISDKTKLKICKIAKKFDYVPNSSGRALRNRKTRIIAVIVPQIASVFYSEIISKIHEIAFNRGYRVLILESFYCKQREFECIHSIRDQCVDGIIVIKTLQKSNDSFNKISRLPYTPRLPVVIQRLNEFTRVTDENKGIPEKSFKALLTKINNIEK